MACIAPLTNKPDIAKSEPSTAAIWPPLRRFISREHRLGRFMARRRWTSALYEFIRFGLKQGWACLFGGIAVSLMIATWWFYPATASLPRYDFLFLCMIAVQIALLAGRLETSEEAKVILIYHVVGTAMEIFKTSVGSWIYPEPNFFRISGVPLFSGFMYACIGSYLCRAWRLFDFEFSHHPRRLGLTALSVAIYVNFFSHHFMPDLRWLLFALPEGCSSAPASISGSGMITVRCRCCSGSRWCRSSSGSRKTSERSQKSGSIRRSGSAGRWSPSTSSAPGSCC